MTESAQLDLANLQALRRAQRLVEEWDAYEWQAPCSTPEQLGYARGCETTTHDRANELREALMNAEGVEDHHASPPAQATSIDQGGDA